MSVVIAKDLSLAYGSNIVINSANFEIKKGDFVCVVGANGSGKSTLIKAILGLIKPVAGEVGLKDGIKKTSVGYMPQDKNYEVEFPATVSEIVLSGALGRLKRRPFYRKREKSKLDETLETLKISYLKFEKFSSLSGGERQKVLLARALTATTSLLILDEPSNNLDHDSKKDFYKTLKKLNKSKKLTIIMITHDLDADDLIGNKVISIKNGKVTSKSTKQFLRSYK